MKLRYWYIFGFVMVFVALGVLAFKGIGTTPEPSRLDINVGTQNVYCSKGTGVCECLVYADYPPFDCKNFLKVCEEQGEPVTCSETRCICKLNFPGVPFKEPGSNEIPNFKLKNTQ